MGILHRSILAGSIISLRRIRTIHRSITHHIHTRRTILRITRIRPTDIGIRVRIMATRLHLRSIRLAGTEATILDTMLLMTVATAHSAAIFRPTTSVRIGVEWVGNDD